MATIIVKTAQTYPCSVIGGQFTFGLVRCRAKAQFAAITFEGPMPICIHCIESARAHANNTTS